MPDWMTLDEVEFRIFEIYQFFHRESPGTVVQEAGELAALWAIFDRAVAEGNA